MCARCWQRSEYDRDVRISDLRQINPITLNEQPAIPWVLSARLIHFKVRARTTKYIERLLFRYHWYDLILSEITEIGRHK